MLDRSCFLYYSTMRGVFNINLILLFYGLNIFTNLDGHALKYASSLKNSDMLKAEGKANEKDYGSNIKQTQRDVFYNPVSQNYSSLFDYPNAVHRNKQDRNAKHSRQKRSRSRNCSGQCENSLCPWREVWDEERTRIPQFIKYAVCDSPTCTFTSLGLDFVSSFTMEMRTHCDLVKIDIQVTEDGQEKWLTDWPIACVCTQRVIDTDVAIRLRHPGRNTDRVDVDITNTVSLEPASRQRLVYQGARQRSLTRAQRRRLRNQRRNMQNAESWEQLMERKNNRT